ncbi:MAG: RnfABCDGE type electron transport complex subunit D [Candidatus Micrarchaeota archaeon]
MEESGKNPQGAQTEGQGEPQQKPQGLQMQNDPDMCKRDDGRLNKIRCYPLYRSTIILLLIAAAIGIAEFSDPVGAIVSLAICTISALIADFAIFYALTKKQKISENAVNTGLIIGAILSPVAPLWQLCLLSVLAVASKYVLRHKGMPLLNPAALAVVVGGLAFGLYGEWWAANERVVFLIAAIILAWKLNKWIMEIAFVVAWAIAHIALSTYSGALVGHPVFLVPAYFMAFMLLEPKTSPMKNSRQAIYGAIVGLLAASTFAIDMAVDNLALVLLVGNIAKKAMDMAKI